MQIVAADAVLAFDRGAARLADQGAQRRVGSAVFGKHHYFQTVHANDFAADDQLQRQIFRGCMGADDACYRALVGQRKPRIAELERRLHELGGMGRAAQERKVTEAVEFGVTAGGACDVGHRLRLSTE